MGIGTNYVTGKANSVFIKYRYMTKRNLGIMLGAIALLLVAFSAGQFKAQYGGLSLGGVTSQRAVGEEGIADEFGLPSNTSTIGYADKSMFPIPTPTAPSTPGTGPVNDRKVIRNGQLELLVSNVDDTAAGVQAIAKQFGGFVDNVNVYEVRSGVKAGQLTIRVPADKFEEVLGDLKGLAVKVDREQIQGDDVTVQVIDLEGQLKNLRATETQYQEILKQARNVEEILQVTQYLSGVRAQIEQTQGQLNYYSRQIDMSTIQVSLTAEADVEVLGLRWRPLYVAKLAVRRMLDGLTSYVDAMIGFVFLLPVLFIWTVTLGLAVYIVSKIAIRIQRRYFSNSSL